MRVLSLRPWRSARALELLIFLLFILEAHFLFQLARLPPTAVRTPLMMGNELSDDAPGEGLLGLPMSPKLCAGLEGRGEKVP